MRGEIRISWFAPSPHNPFKLILTSPVWMLSSAPLNPAITLPWGKGRVYLDAHKEYAMRKFTRGAAALVLGTALSATATGQAPIAPPAAPPMNPAATQQGTAPVVPLLTPAAPVPDIRPTGIAATVNNQPIQEVEVYRHLRQFPQQNWE